jgi:hypothetical protein
LRAFEEQGRAYFSGGSAFDGRFLFDGLRTRLEYLFLTCKKDAVGLLIALELWHGDDLAGFGIFHCTYVNMKMTEMFIYSLV